MTQDGLLICGNTSAPGLYLNTRLGMLAWTIATVTSEKTARVFIQDFGATEALYAIGS